MPEKDESKKKKNDGLDDLELSLLSKISDPLYSYMEIDLSKTKVTCSANQGSIYNIHDKNFDTYWDSGGSGKKHWIQFEFRDVACVSGLAYFANFRRELSHWYPEDRINPSSTSTRYARCRQVMVYSVRSHEYDKQIRDKFLSQTAILQSDVWHTRDVIKELEDCIHPPTDDEDENDEKDNSNNSSTKERNRTSSRRSRSHGHQCYKLLLWNVSI